ncbi:MAG: hypothetical protein H0Z24_07765 [Thermosipho sp. (in: Bacteria)]|nr:hypothetical protein [Thermosipho sp. (in: thermotogales)]
MKRTLIITLLFLFALTLFSLDIEKSKERFLFYVENFGKETDDQFLNDIEPLIMEDLPLYRFYKIWLVGSVEKTDVTKKVGDYLRVIYQEYQSDTDEEKLAKAAFMSYLEARLERKKFESSFIKASPNFNLFFNSYQNRVVLAARKYFTDLLAKHLGADIELPVDIDAPYFDFSFNYEPKYTIKGYEFEFQFIASDPEFINAFNKYLEVLSKDPEKIEKSIGRYGGLLQRSVIKVVAGLKNKYSETFAEIAPKKLDFWWIRWIIYGLLIVLTIFVFKKWKLAILLISLSEIVYLFLGFDILSNSSSTIYGLISIFGFITATMIFIKKREFINLLVSMIVVVSFFVPTFYTEDLIMSNNDEFNNSLYFNALVDDVLRDDYTKFSNLISALVNEINSSINETESIVGRLQTNANNYALKIQESQYLNVDNFEQRINDFKMVANEFENYRIEESIRMRKYLSYEKDMLKFTEKIAKISSEKLESFFKDELRKDLDFDEVNPTVKKINNVLDTTSDLKRAPIKFYRTKYGLLTFAFLTIGLLFTSIRFKQDLIWYIAALISSVFMLINPIEFIVQYGVPILKVNYVLTIPLLVIAVVIMLIKRLIPHKG